MVHKIAHICSHHLEEHYVLADLLSKDIVHGTLVAEWQFELNLSLIEHVIQHILQLESRL